VQAAKTAKSSEALKKTDKRKLNAVRRELRRKRRQAE
jgi:hypothetical protein